MTLSSAGFQGWQMPANVLVSSSHNTTQGITGELSVNINVLPYDVSANTTLYMGLYVNGNLVAHMTQRLGNSHAQAATMIGEPSVISGNQLMANFTADNETPGVAVQLGNSLAAGSVITFTAYTNSPIWVQVAPIGTLKSYETTGAAAISTSLPSNLLANATQVPVQLYIQGQGIKVAA